MAVLKNLIVLGSTQLNGEVYASQIVENGTSLSSKYAPISHTHTKSEVGLSNVDNTADSAKSVNYANSAGSAGSVSRLTCGDKDNGSHDCNAITSNGFWYYTANGPSLSLGVTLTNSALYSQAYSTSWVGQIAQDYGNGKLCVRGRNNGTWQSWMRVIDSSMLPIPSSSDSGKFLGVNSSGAYTVISV